MTIDKLTFPMKGSSKRVSVSMQGYGCAIFSPVRSLYAMTVQPLSDEMANVVNHFCRSARRREFIWMAKMRRMGMPGTTSPKGLDTDEVYLLSGAFGISLAKGIAP